MHCQSIVRRLANDPLAGSGALFTNALYESSGNEISASHVLSRDTFLESS
jgi:hypothetical protein